MKKIVLVICSLFLTVSAQAASKAELSGLLERIDNELRFYNQSSETLEIVKEKLEEALLALRGVSSEPSDSQICLDYVFAEFKKDGYSGSISLDNAKDVCGQMEDQQTSFDILSYFYVKIHAEGYSAPKSFEHALNISRGVIQAQMRCVKSAFARYNQDGYSVKTSLEKAVIFCRN